MCSRGHTHFALFVRNFLPRFVFVISPCSSIRLCGFFFLYLGDVPSCSWNICCWIIVQQSWIVRVHFHYISSCAEINSYCIDQLNTNWLPSYISLAIILGNIFRSHFVSIFFPSGTVIFQCGMLTSPHIILICLEFGAYWT